METASFILVVAMNTMKTRYRLIHRGHRGGKFYAVEKATGIDFFHRAMVPIMPDSKATLDAP